MHNPDYEPRYTSTGARAPGKPHRMDMRVLTRDTSSPRGLRFLVSGMFAQDKHHPILFERMSGN